MLGILLLLFNNHRKLKDTIDNTSFTRKRLNEAREKNKKYFSDKYGHDYDVNTGHMVRRGRDKYTGHRGVIDVKTGRAVEDFIETSISKHTEEYMNGRFVDIKDRLDARRECLKTPLQKQTPRYYYTSKNKKYKIFWNYEVKRFIDDADREGKVINDNELRIWLKRGYSPEEIYEYYCWKGQKLEYPFHVNMCPQKKILN